MTLLLRILAVLAVASAVLGAFAIGEDVEDLPCCMCMRGLVEIGNEGDSEEQEEGSSQRRVRTARAACEGDETAVHLQGMALSALPECISPFAVQVNASRNRLQRLPSAAQLNPLLVALDVSDNGIGETSGDELRLLSALEELRVGGNPVRSLSFLPAPCALRHLHAQRCALTTLQEATRCGLLESLFASGNALEALPPGALFPLRRLRRLDLSRNPIVTLAARAFAGLGELQELRLSGTGLQALPQMVFDLPKLLHLDLSNNNISVFPPTTALFAQDNAISVLELQGNKLKSVPWELLQPLQSLSGLNMANNKIENVPGKLFQRYVPNLEKLSLANNNLHSLPADTLEGLGFLEELDLSQNPLSQLPSGLLSGLVSLDALSLSGCPLKTLSFSMDTPLLELSYLDAMGISLMTLPPGALLSMPDLKCLNLQKNPIMSLRSGAFMGANKMKTLFLGGSKQSTLKKLPEDVFIDLPNLETLDLGGNKLESISSGIFHNNEKLKRVNIKNNKLTKLPKGVFAHLGRLQELQASHNRLQNLPVLKSCCDDLRFVSFSNNSISWPSDAAVRQLLRAGSGRRREVDLRGNPVRPEALLALARVPEASLRRESGACGSVRRAAATLRLCVDGPRSGDGGGAGAAWDAAEVEAEALAMEALAVAAVIRPEEDSLNEL